MMVEETSFHVGGAEFEAEDLREIILEVGPLLWHRTADLGEGGAEAEGVGWVEGEDLEERTREASRVTSAVEGQRTIRWVRLTLTFNSGVSQPNSLSPALASFIYSLRPLFPDESPQSGQNTPGGRGRGSPSKPNGNNIPRGRGGSGGRGGHAPKLPSTSSLSSLWYEERPLLRPIKFVRSVEAATLFQEAEELLEPTVENPGKCTPCSNPVHQLRIQNSSCPGETAEGHAPTADKVSRVFSNTHPHLFDNSFFGIEEGIEEVNFEDLALVHERVLDSAPATLPDPTVQGEIFNDIIRKPATEPGVQPEEISDVALMTTETTIRTKTKAAEIKLPGRPVARTVTETAGLMTSTQDEPMVVEPETTITTAEPVPTATPKDTPPLFVVDTNPSTSHKQIPVPAYEVHLRTVFPGESVMLEAGVEPDPEDDVIVYDAPNPRISTPKVDLATLADISFPNHTPSSTPRQINPLRRGKFAHVVGRNAKRGSSGVTGVKRKRLADHRNFAAFGAMIAEARLRSQDDMKDKDPKEHLRRQGDSDIDWGGETDEDDEEGGPAVATAEGMDLDPDLVGSGVTMAAMKGFVEAINGNHVTMDDLEDANTEEDSTSDDEVDGEEDDDEDVESDEERMLIEEFLSGQDGSDLSGDDEDDGLDPRAGFQARLDRLRKKQQKMIETGGDEDEDETDPDFKWSEGEEIDVRKSCVPRSRDLHVIPRILSKKPSANTRRTGWRVMRSSGPSRMVISMSRSLNLLRQVGSSPERIVSPRTDDSIERKDLPAELQEQWEKDRLKKAKQKRERDLARLEAATDPLITKKGGKKSKKAMIAAARLDPSIGVPHRIVDMVSVEQQIRRFLANKDKKDMALPACDKSTRKKIHSLAALFGLGSKSKGGALGRYTTLTKTKDSGKNVDERQVARTMKGFKYRASYVVSDDDWDGGGKGKGKRKGNGKGKGKSMKERDQSGHLKTKEGDVVGHVRARSFIESDSPWFRLTNGLPLQAAPKIGETNVGFMMLASMGWSDGATIGMSGGLDAPIAAVIKKTKLGLGASVSTRV